MIGVPWGALIGFGVDNVFLYLLRYRLALARQFGRKKLINVAKSRKHLAVRWNERPVKPVLNNYYLYYIFP